MPEPRWLPGTSKTPSFPSHLCRLLAPAAPEQQREKLLQEDLFDLGAEGDVKCEGKEVFGPDVDASSEDEESDEADNETDRMDVHRRFLWAWENRKPKLQHEYAMAGFALSVATDVWNRAAQPNMLGT